MDTGVDVLPTTDRSLVFGHSTPVVSDQGRTAWGSRQRATVGRLSGHREPATLMRYHNPTGKEAAAAGRAIPTYQKAQDEAAMRRESGGRKPGDTHHSGMWSRISADRSPLIVVLHKKLDERRYMTEVRLSVIQTRKCIWDAPRSFRSARNGDETAETVTDIRAYLVVVKATLARPNDAWIVDDYQIVSVAGPVR